MKAFFNQIRELIPTKKKWKSWTVLSRATYLSFILAVIMFLLYFVDKCNTPTTNAPAPQEEVIPVVTNKTKPFRSIFPPNDKENFNVLIIRFEDYINHDDTDCIGRAIQENFSVIQAKDNLTPSLVAEYADSIPPPNTPQKALAIQKKHNADLIIYGLARNLQEGCAGAEVCFRFNINETVVDQITPFVKIKTSKHDLEYTNTSPMAIENGILQIDALSLKYWITSLVNVKAGKPDEAFIKLAVIGEDSTSLSNTQLANRFFTIGKTFSNLNQSSKAIKAFDKAISLDPGGASAYNNRGNAYYALKDYDHAILDYDKAISLDPGYTMAYTNRGIAYRKLKDYDRTILDFDKAISLDPEYALAYTNRGITYDDLKDYDHAILDYDKAISLDPEHVLAYNNRGITYRKLKDHDRAILDYDKAISLDPDYAAAYNNRGITYYELKGYDRAILDFDKAISLDPELATTYTNRGITYKKLKDYDRAILDYDKAISLDPEYAAAYNNRGNAYRILKDYDRAILDFDKVVSLDQEYAAAYNNRGIVYYELKDYDRAILDYDKAISLDPDYAGAYNNQGIAYFYLKDYDRAIENYQMVIKSDSTNINAYIVIFWIYAFNMYWYISIPLILMILFRKNIKKLIAHFWNPVKASQVEGDSKEKIEEGN